MGIFGSSRHCDGRQGDSGAGRGLDSGSEEKCSLSWGKGSNHYGQSCRKPGNAGELSGEADLRYGMPGNNSERAGV